MTAASQGRTRPQPLTMAPADQDSFAFTAENLEKVRAIIAKYPSGRQASAVLPVLDLAQRQNGWVSTPVVETVAGLLDMAPIRVMEVATFYTMFMLKPIGRWHLQLCATTPCWLCGSDDVFRACKEVAGIGYGETDETGTFTLTRVECVGACVNAPVLQVNDDFYEDLDYDSTKSLLEALKRDDPPPFGSVVGRQGSAPAGCPQVLITPPTGAAAPDQA